DGVAVGRRGGDEGSGSAGGHGNPGRGSFAAGRVSRDVDSATGRRNDRRRNRRSHRADRRIGARQPASRDEAASREADMSDYLWDKRGKPDPEIERLKLLLSRFGQPTSVRFEFPASAS